jgi:hypothetical protein
MKTEIKKPKAQIIGANGNVFSLLGICSAALKSADQRESAVEMKNRVLSCGSYSEALEIMSEYCELC